MVFLTVHLETPRLSPVNRTLPLRRFVAFVDSLRQRTQFIVVTHNKRTMAAADTLYGVTMEEEGVSKIVAVNFETDNIARFTQN